MKVLLDSIVSVRSLVPPSPPPVFTFLWSPQPQVSIPSVSPTSPLKPLRTSSRGLLFPSPHSRPFSRSIRSPTLYVRSRGNRQRRRHKHRTIQSRTKTKGRHATSLLESKLFSLLRG